MMAAPGPYGGGALTQPAGISFKRAPDRPGAESSTSGQKRAPPPLGQFLTSSQAPSHHAEPPPIR
jgi:hypothetical protein